MPASRQQIQDLATNLLAECGVDRLPVPVEAIARRCGAVVVQVDADDELSGFLMRRPAAEGNLIGVNRAHHPLRRRFTVAHELGHMLLHTQEPLHVDRQTGVFLRNHVSSAGVERNETEANLFAAELLMPKEWVLQHFAQRRDPQVVEDAELRELAKRFGVSQQAMTIRLANLGAISLG